MNGFTSSNASQLYDASEVRNALKVLVPSGQVTELRVLEATLKGKRWTATFSGYFDDAEKLVAALSAISSAKGIYIIPNPVNRDLMARACNRLRRAQKGDSTSDKSITERKWLMIDCDFERAAGISASDVEHAAALQRCQEIASYFTELGWTDPIRADSGNGGHLLYPIDLPASDDGMVNRVLTALSDRFSFGGVKVDTTVGNPARIWKLYGTRACKGDNVPDRPHRMSQIQEVPKQLEAVSKIQLVTFAGEKKVVPATSLPILSGFSIDRFIQQHQLDVSDSRPYDGGRCWTLNSSPLCDHGGDGPFLMEFTNGALAAGCHHNSCNWNWHDLRKHFEPKKTAERTQSRFEKVISTPQLTVQRGLPAKFPVHTLPRRLVVIHLISLYPSWHASRNQLATGGSLS
jgi:hypothetical protein